MTTKKQSEEKKLAAIAKEYGLDPLGDFLKDKESQPDPNIIYPGKDLTNVFPEEEP